MRPPAHDEFVRLHLIQQAAGSLLCSSQHMRQTRDPPCRLLQVATIEDRVAAGGFSISLFILISPTSGPVKAHTSEHGLCSWKDGRFLGLRVDFAALRPGHCELRAAGLTGAP